MLLSECDCTTIRCNLHRGRNYTEIFEFVTIKSNESNQIVDFHIYIINRGLSINEVF